MKKKKQLASSIVFNQLFHFLPEGVVLPEKTAKGTSLFFGLYYSLTTSIIQYTCMYNVDV